MVRLALGVCCTGWSPTMLNSLSRLWRMRGGPFRFPISRAIDFLVLATLAVGVLYQARITLFGGFTVLGDAVVAERKILPPNLGEKGGQLEMISVEPSE
jgi:hypothetical protein